MIDRRFPDDFNPKMVFYWPYNNDEKFCIQLHFISRWKEYEFDAVEELSVHTNVSEMSAEEETDSTAEGTEDEDDSD